MTAPVIKADFVKPMPVPSRKVLQLTFEVPEEQADHAMAVLGGYPQSGENRWCGIALLNVDEASAEEDVTTPEPEVTPLKGGPLAKQAGILCATPAFQGFLRDWYNTRGVWLVVHDELGYAPSNAAASVVRDYCDIGSRAELDHNLTAAQTWKELIDTYHADQEGRGIDQMERMRRD